MKNKKSLNFSSFVKSSYYFVNLLIFTNKHHPLPPWVKSRGFKYKDARIEGRVGGIYMKMQGLKEK